MKHEFCLNRVLKMCTCSLIGHNIFETDEIPTPVGPHHTHIKMHIVFCCASAPRIIPNPKHML